MPSPRTINFFVAGLALCSSISNAGAIEPRSIMIDGESVESSCSEKMLKTLKQAIVTKVGTKQSDDAFDVVKLLLCSEANDSAKEQVFGRMTPVILVHDSATGDADHFARKKRSKELAAELLRAGEAWKSDVEAKTTGTLVLTFNPDEACVYTVNLTLQKNRWFISKAATACD